MIVFVAPRARVETIGADAGELFRPRHARGWANAAGVPTTTDRPAHRRLGDGRVQRARRAVRVWHVERVTATRVTVIGRRLSLHNVATCVRANERQRRSSCHEYQGACDNGGEYARGGAGHWFPLWGLRFEIPESICE